MPAFAEITIDIPEEEDKTMVEMEAAVERFEAALEDFLLEQNERLGLTAAYRNF